MAFGAAIRGVQVDFLEIAKCVAVQLAQVKADSLAQIAERVNGVDVKRLREAQLRAL